MASHSSTLRIELSGDALSTKPLLRFLGASDRTIAYASSYALIVIVIGVLPSMLSMVLAHLLRKDLRLPHLLRLAER